MFPTRLVGVGVANRTLFPKAQDCGFLWVMLLMIAGGGGTAQRDVFMTLDLGGDDLYDTKSISDERKKKDKLVSSKLKTCASKDTLKRLKGNQPVEGRK